MTGRVVAGSHGTDSQARSACWPTVKKMQLCLYVMAVIPTRPRPGFWQTRIAVPRGPVCRTSVRIQIAGVAPVHRGPEACHTQLTPYNRPEDLGERDKDWAALPLSCLHMRLHIARPPGAGLLGCPSHHPAIRPTAGQAGSRRGALSWARGKGSAGPASHITPRATACPGAVRVGATIASRRDGWEAARKPSPLSRRGADAVGWGGLCC